MATATQTPDAATQQVAQQVDTNTTSERTDYIVGHNIVKVKDDKGNEVTKREEAFYDVSKEEFQNDLKKLIEEGKFIQSYQVTVSVPRAKNFAGIKEICPNEEEAAMNFNRGAKQKANNRLKAKLLEINEDTKEFVWLPDGVDPETGKPNLTNGVLDMTEEIASASKKKVRTEEEKLDNFLKDYPEATRNMMKAAYLASRQAAQPVPALAG